MRPLLALFIRSLREETRHRWTYLLRAAFVGLILFWLFITHETTRWSGAPGRQFFLAVLWINLVVGSVAGLSYFASAISEEKEDGTLGLLRMADLNALAILLGKGTGRLVGALFLIVAQIPFALLAVTMGGLTVAQVLAGYVCLLSFTFLLGNLGLLASVLCRTTARASVMAMLGLGGFLFGPTATLGVESFLGHLKLPTLPLSAHDFLDAWRSALPGPRMNTVLATAYSGGLWSAQATASVALGGLCFVLAWLAFEPTSMRASDPDAAMASGRARLRRSRRAKGLHPAAAIRWKEFRQLGGRGVLVWRTVLTLVIVGGMASATTSASLAPTAWKQVGYTCFSMSGLLFVVFITADAARIFGTERKQQTLSSLLLVPVSAASIAWEKTLGLLALNWPPLALALTGGAFGPLQDLLREWQSMFDGRWDGVMGLCSIAFGALALTALPVFVAWLSLWMRRGSTAVGVTVWLIGGWIMTMFAFLLMREGALVAIPCVCVVMIGYFAKEIPRRLESLAAEE